MKTITQEDMAQALHHIIEASKHGLNIHHAQNVNEVRVDANDNPMPAEFSQMMEHALKAAKIMGYNMEAKKCTL